MKADVTRLSPLGELLSVVKSQAWFMLFVLGMGASFALIETHRQLVTNGMQVGSPESLFCGHTCAALLFVVLWVRNSGAGSAEKGFFLYKPLVSLVPALGYAAPIFAIGVSGAVGAPLPAPALEALTFCIGASVVTFLFLWGELAVTLKRSLAIFSVGLALIVAGFLYIYVYILCSTPQNLIVLGATSLSLPWIYRESCHLNRRARQDESLTTLFEDARPITQDGTPPQSQGDCSRLVGLRRIGERQGRLFLPLVFLYYFAFSCLFVTGPSDALVDMPILGQVLAIGGILACGVIVCAVSPLAENWERPDQVLHMLVFLILFVCLLLAYLLRNDILSTLPLYLARELIMAVVFLSAFVVDGYVLRMRRLSEAAALWLLGWVVYRLADEVLSSLGLPSSNILAVLALLVVMVVAIHVFLTMMGRYSRGASMQDDGRAIDRRRDVLRELSESFDLTERERELLPLLSIGLSAEYIAKRFYISPATVRTHAHNIYQKAGISSQHELSEMIDLLMREQGGPEKTGPHEK